MRIYTFGNSSNPVIMLFPGTCCHWKVNFGEIIPLLKEHFYVACVSYDGFDETEYSVFPDMLTETAKIEKYIQKRFGGHILAVYGCSLGGSFVGLLMQRGNIRIDHGILGSSDLDHSGSISAWLMASIVTSMLFGMFRKGKLSGFMQKRLNKKTAEERQYYDKMLDMFGMRSTHMSFVKKQSIFNQFYSDLTTPLRNNIAVPGTTVHCFYATKMGEKYLKRYYRHFQNPDICQYDMQHEELLICHPKMWVAEVRKCCGV